MLVRKLSAVMLAALMMIVGLLISDDVVEYRLSRGWNLIGGADVAFSSSVIEDVDEVIPPVYSYDPSGRVYTAVESIVPLVGYWVLCSDDVIVSIGDTVPDIECPPTVTDYDGNVYATVMIGSQCWMAENLKTTHYRDGSAIPHVTDNSEWEGLSTGAYAEYRDFTRPDPEVNVMVFGRLYNWFAVDDARGLCPAGWRVPSDDDWKVLERYMGVPEDELDLEYSRGTNQGSQLAGNADAWWDGTLKDDPAFGSSGFNALGSGYRWRDGGYSYVYREAYFWTSNEVSPTNSVERSIVSGIAGISRLNQEKQNGFCVRCLLD